MLPDFDLTKFLTATAGAVVSMAKWPGTLVERAVMGAAGVVVSYFASDAVSGWTGVPPGLCGFLLGLFGMSIVGKIWDAIAAIDARKITADLWDAFLGRLKK